MKEAGKQSVIKLSSHHFKWSAYAQHRLVNHMLDIAQINITVIF